MLLPPSVDSTHPFTQVAVICFTPTNDNNYHYINHVRETRGVGNRSKQPKQRGHSLARSGRLR
ncbi:hypothetical protein C0073_018570 [Aeromonas veronii]|nr:hypothetical protein C0073_018570 [Aeromonas veronii]